MDARLVIGLFDSRDKAIAAIRDLKERGFSETDMGMLSREGGRAEGVDSIPAHEDRAAAGGLGGAFIGASIGTLVGLGVLAGVVPVIGPAIAAGTLGVLITNAAGGMAVVGLAGALIGYGLHRDEAEEFEKEVQAGKTIVTLRTDNVSDAVITMQQHGAEVRAHSPADPQHEATKPYDALAEQPMFYDVGPGSTLSDPSEGVDLASTGSAGAVPGYAAYSQAEDVPGRTAPEVTSEPPPAPMTPREDIPNPRAYRDDSAVPGDSSGIPVAALSDEEQLTRTATGAPTGLEETKLAEPVGEKFDEARLQVEFGNDQPVLPAASEDSEPILPPQPPQPLDADPALLVPRVEDEGNVPGDEAKKSDAEQATRMGQATTQRPAPAREEPKPPADKPKQVPGK